MKENMNLPILENKIVLYRKDRPILFLVMGFVHLAIFAMPNDFSLIHLPIPLVLFGFALSSYKKVALSFVNGSLEHKAIFGPTVKNYRYSELSDFLVLEQTLCLQKKGKTIKICSIWLLDKNSLNELNFKIS
jgi:hypothetical protein